MSERHAPDTMALVAAGCGTAIASVCACGLFQIEQRLGGVWSVLAVLTAGLCCAVLARAFGRLSDILPSGAGLLAYMARGFGRPVGVFIVVPYLLLSLFLVGAEAIIVGVLVSRFLPVPIAAGALAFLVGTWALCRIGVRAGYVAQAVATWSLVGALGALSVMAIAGAANRGELSTRLLPAAPTAATFVAGVGQALFLFMGFELITSHAEVAATPRAVRRSLGVSVVILTLFYALVSVGFSAMGGASLVSSRFVPQLAMAEMALGPIGALLVVSLTLVASFTSWNGGLLALSRFSAALASQGLLPRRLARVDPRTLVARDALAALLFLGVLFTAIVGFGDALEPAILAAAVAAAFVYAGALWVRELPPFREPTRPAPLRLVMQLISVAFGLLGVAVVVDARAALPVTLALLTAAFTMAFLLARRSARRLPRIPSAGPRVAPEPLPPTRTEEAANAD